MWFYDTGYKSSGLPFQDEVKTEIYLLSRVSRDHFMIYLKEADFMNKSIYLILTILLASHSSIAKCADLGQNQLTGGTAVRKLEPDKMLTSGGIKGVTEGDLSVQPEFGVSHTVHQREVAPSHDGITDKIHAQAGGRVKFSDMFYLGFATKIPIYNYGKTEARTPGGSTTSTSSKHEYEILRMSPNNLKLTGEVGVKLGPLVDINMYYDQNTLTSPTQPGTSSDEQVIGTKFIFRFK